MRRVVGHALVIAVILATFAPATATASSIGAGTNVGKIELAPAVSRGSSRSLPDVTYFNTGDVTTTYTVQVMRVEGSRAPSEDWFSFVPRRITLAPKASQKVSIRMNVPNDAVSGYYEALIVASSDRKVPTRNGGLVNVAAGPRLKMTVAQGNPFANALAWIGDFFNRTRPWSYAAVIALAVLLAAIGLSLRRRRADDEMVGGGLSP